MRNRSSKRKKCNHCGEEGKKECKLCNRFKNGMPSKKYYAICARITSLYPVKKKRRVFPYKRVVAHPLCNGKCVARDPSYDSLKIRDEKNVISEEDFMSIIKKPCIFCGVHPSNGVDRCDSSFSYIKENVQACCFQCNIMKKNESTKTFVDKLNEVFIKQYL